MKSYVGLNGASSSQDKLFACPADKFFYEFTATNQTYDQIYVAQSYHAQRRTIFRAIGSTRNTARLGTNSPGLAGRTLSSIKHPARTVLVADMPAFLRGRGINRNDRFPGT